VIIAGRSIDFFEAWGRTYLMAPTPDGAILSNAMPTPRRADYALRFSSETERRFLRCRASVRAAIRDRLESIAQSAAKPSRRSKQPGPNEPPLRFYVYEGYRVVYQVEEATRRVIVLDLAVVSS
jgi:mRNA-degrading endonuclease RelE of RelBE toxin-antitoxin system